MSNLEVGLWSLPILLGLIFVRIPIGLAMLLVGVMGSYVVTGTSVPVFNQFKSLTYSTFSGYSLTVVPLFLLMGQFASVSGMSGKLFDAAAAWVGHKKGGIALSAIVASGGFGALCGSSMATAATMGKVALPALKKHGYSGGLATATVATGGTLGILIPPSVILIIYAVLAEQNIADLFLVAFVPGILAMLFYMLAISIIVRLWPEQAGTIQDKSTLKQRLKSTIDVWPVLVIFLIVLVGIYSGVFSPTEAAAIGAVLTLIVAMASGNMSRKNIIESIVSTATGTGMMFFIVLGAAALNGFLAMTQLPQAALELITALGLSPWGVLVIILIFYMVLGCFMDSLSMILLTVPIFYPVVSILDFGMTPDEFGLWFGILILIVVELGLITPPVGMNLFIINNMDKETPLIETYKSVIPFIIADIIRVGLLVICPAIVLFVL